MSALPEPGPAAAEHSQRLVKHLNALISAEGGWLNFASFMEQALYAPGLGYYSCGAAKFGTEGDFVTAPEISPLFGQTLAGFARSVLTQVGGAILEVGAGTGRLACQILKALAEQNALPDSYAILEVSADLRERQQATLAHLPAAVRDRVTWLEVLPESFTGVMLGNEVLDAMPVHLVNWHESGLLERGVVCGREGFTWDDRPLGPGALRDQARTVPVQSPYVSEISLAAPAFVRSLGERLVRGVLLFIDYGFGRREFYHPQRDSGTLMCHYRHHSHADPFFLPGLQDITAHVEFTGIAEAGIDAGLSLLGYTSQAGFLIDGGITRLLERESAEPKHFAQLASGVQKLLSPAEMGELFKVVALGKGVEAPLPGFRQLDLRRML